MAGQNPIDVHVGSRIRAERERTGTTPRELARKLGISTETLKRLEAGTTRTTAGRLFQIASFLNVSVAGFYEGLSVRPAEPEIFEVKKRDPILKRS